MPSADLTRWTGGLDEAAFMALTALVKAANERSDARFLNKVNALFATEPQFFFSEGPDLSNLMGVFGDSHRALPALGVKRELPARTTLPSLFICYRRTDTADTAGRLHDRLSETYGRERVFMDIEGVPLGIDFVNHVTEQISRCSAVIVMIGSRWLTTKDKKRRRRLDVEDDLVRTEIAAALHRSIPIIPVLVKNAKMPAADDLPENIRLLARRNGIELSATRWRTGVERLIKELDRVMKSSSGS